MTPDIKTKWYYTQLVKSINASSATRAIAHLYYLFAYFFIKFYFKKFFTPYESIWIRNSFYSGNTVLGLSDIDFSLSITDKTNLYQLELFLLKINKLKKFFPFIGELNVFDKNNISDFLPFCNSFELNRDSNLKKLAKNRQLTKDQAYTYILRCLSSDYHHLLLFPELRVKKWQNHLIEIESFTNYKLHKVNRNTPIEILNSIHVNSEIISILDRLYYTKNLFKFNSREVAYCLLLYPSKIYHINNSTELNDELIKEITILCNSHNDLLFKNFFNQMEWEIWGLYTQINSQKLLNLESHLIFMKELTDIIAQLYNKPNTAYTIINGLEKLLSYNQSVHFN